MKLLADESAEGPLIARLREEGYDVTSVGELGGGIDDPEVLEVSEREGRILLTNDKDFAELAFLQRKASVGIILSGASSCSVRTGTSPRSSWAASAERNVSTR